MRRSRLYTQQPLKAHNSVILDSKQSHYLSKVLRLKVNDTLVLFNGVDSFDYPAVITCPGKRVTLLIENSIPNTKESSLLTTLYQALSKNEHIDSTIQKCTELGIHSIHIFNSEHTQIPLKKTKLEKKLLHWNHIAQSACEQCGRSIVPSIKFFSSLEDMLSPDNTHLRIMFDFEGEAIQTFVKNEKTLKVDLLIGAEGGLSHKEIQFAQSCLFNKVRLGPRVLRTETAAIAALGVIQMIAGDLN